MATQHDKLKYKPFKRLGNLRNVMVFFLVLYTLAEVCFTMLAAGTLWAVHSVEAGALLGLAYYEFIEVLTFVEVLAVRSYLIILLFCFVFVGWFTFRAMRNLHIIDAKDADMSPTGTILWHAVPIACFFAPFSGMAQIWRGSANPDGNESTLPTSMRWWWAGWVIVMIGGSIARRLIDGTFGQDQDLIIAGLYTILISSPFGALAGVCLISFSKGIVRNQDVIAGSRDSSITVSSAAGRDSDATDTGSPVIA